MDPISKYGFEGVNPRLIAGEVPLAFRRRSHPPMTMSA
jgi:hypothetical protein